MRRTLLALVGLLSACGGSTRSTPATAASTTEPSPAAASADSPTPADVDPPLPASEIDHTRVERGGNVSIAGVTYTFSAFSPDGVVDAVGFVGLTDPSGAVLRAPTHGCLRTAGATVRVASVASGPPVVAELAVSPGVGSERAVQWLETVDLAADDRLSSPDGHVVSVRTIRERIGALIWDLEARTGDGPAEAIAASEGGTAFGGDRLVSAEPTDRRDPFGCPIARVTLERPSLVMTATDGAEIRIRRGSRARLGNLTVRYVGLGERRRVNAGDVALVSLEITVGATTEQRIAHFDETLELAGYAIDVIDAGRYARVRLRTR